MNTESVELPSDLEALIKEAKDAASTDWEKSFVKDLAARHKKWGDELYLSEKQLAALRKIATPAVDEIPAGEEEGEEA